MTSDPITGAASASSYYNDILIQSAAQRTANTSGSALGMSDFIQLLVAQLQNQDMLNPMDNTQFVSQMATFSSLTAMTNLVDQSMTSYAVSLLGKEVTAATFDQEGRLEKVEGVVTGISLFDGRPKIYIGDMAFDLQSVMTVGKLPEEKKGAEDKEADEDNDLKIDGED